MKIEEIIQQPEGRSLEFKEALPGKTDLNKTIISFANDAGGVLILGVKDKPRAVVGIAESELFDLEEKISASIHDTCSPVILPDISFRKVSGQHILIVKIAKGNNPPYHLKAKGVGKGTYIRVGSANRLANQDFIEELIRKRSNISFDSLPVYDRKLEEIDIHTFQQHFQDNVNEKLTQTVLRKLNLVHQEHGDEFPTHALILLSDDPLRRQIFPYSKVECARFKGKVPGNFIDQKTIDAPLSIQAERAYQFVLRHISQGSEYQGIYRRDRWEYPIIALREVIRNSVIHRDYALKGKDIKIAIFDDKIEITSPGNLLPTVDFNEMDSGQSDIRNKVLAPVFKKLGIIEQLGNGLQLIAEDLQHYPEISFQWSQPGMGFRVSFIKSNDIQQPKSQQQSTENRDDANDHKQLSIEEKKILQYLTDHEKINRLTATGLLGLKKSKTYEILTQMLEHELISIQGKGRGTFYMLKMK